MDQTTPKVSEEGLILCEINTEHISCDNNDTKEDEQLKISDHHEQVCNVDGSTLDQADPKDEENRPNATSIAPISDDSDDEESVAAQQQKTGGEEPWSTITSTAGISYVQREVVCNHAVKLAPNIIRPAMNDAMSNSDEMINEIENFIDKIWYGPVAIEHFNVLDEAKIKEFLADRAEDLYLDLSKVNVWENGMPSLLETRAETSDEFLAFHLVLERNQGEGKFSLRGVESSDTYGRDGCIPVQLGFYFKRGIAGMAVTEHLRMMAARGEGGTQSGMANDDVGIHGDQEEEDILANPSTYSNPESEEMMNGSAANRANCGDDPDDFFVFQLAVSEQKQETSTQTASVDPSNMDISALEMTLLEDGGDEILNDEIEETDMALTTNEESSKQENPANTEKQGENCAIGCATESQISSIADEMMEFESHVMSSEIDALINEEPSSQGGDKTKANVQDTTGAETANNEKQMNHENERSTSIVDGPRDVNVTQQTASYSENKEMTTTGPSTLANGCLVEKELSHCTNVESMVGESDVQRIAQMKAGHLGDSLIEELSKMAKEEPKSSRDSLISDCSVQVKNEPNPEDSLIMESTTSIKKNDSVLGDTVVCVGAIIKEDSLISNRDESMVAQVQIGDDGQVDESNVMIDETSRMTVSSVLSNYRSETNSTRSESKEEEEESPPSIITTTANSFLFFDPFTSQFSSSSSTTTSSQAPKLPYGLYSPILANFKRDTATPVKAPRPLSSSVLVRSSSSSQSSGEGSIPFPASSPVTPLKVSVPGGPVAPSPKKPRKPRKKRCGSCAGCIVAGVCGECPPCKAKVKFGGDGRTRMGCLKRRCLNPIEGVDTTPSSNNNESTTPFRPSICVQRVESIAQSNETLVVEANSAAPPVMKQRKPRKRRCGACEGCLVKDICGECKSCRAKVKFGGDGRTRLGCLKRQCSNPIHAEGYEKQPPNKERKLMKKRVRISVTDQRERKRMKRITKKQRSMMATDSNSTEQQVLGETKTKMQVTNVKMDVFFPRWWWLEMQNEKTEEEGQEALGLLSLFVRRMERRVCMFVDDSNSKGGRRCPFRMSTNRDAFDFEPIPFLLPSTVVDGSHHVSRVEWCVRSRDATPAMLASDKLRPLEQDPTLLRLGCTTFVDVLDAETLKEVEEKTLEVFENSRRNAKTMLRPGTYQHTFAARGRGSTSSRTVTRTKMFFNARYLWNSTQLSHISAKRARGIRMDVERPPRYTTDVVLPALFRCGALKDDAVINQVAINIYHTGTTGIAPHYDDNARFELPVTSIRVFSDSRLSFGCKGSWGISNGEFEIPMLRNSVLVLQEDSYASDVVKHCVRPSDMSGRSAVLLFRKIHEELLREAYEVEVEDITYRLERTSGGYDVKSLVHERLDRLLDDVVTGLDLSDEEEDDEIEEEDERGADDEAQKEQLVLESESGKDVIIEPGIGMEEEEEPAMVRTELVLHQQTS